jgi:hypothetical protein
MDVAPADVGRSRTVVMPAEVDIANGKAVAETLREVIVVGGGEVIADCAA